MPHADTPQSPPGTTDPSHALLALRARAEQRRHLVTQTTERLLPEDALRLVQELQVHQIELEMQYEELLLARDEAQRARAEYLDLYDFAPVGYFSLTELGVMAQLNLCASQLLGSVRQRLVGRRFALFVAPAGRLEFGQFLSRVLRAETTQSLELELQREDGTRLHAQLEGLRVPGHAGPQCRLAVLDVTSRYRATQELTASEARFRKLFTGSSDAVVLLQGHHYLDCNDAALRLLGAQRKDDVAGHNAWEFAPEHQPDGRRTVDLYRETTEDALRTGSRRCEALMRKVTGEEIWVEAVLTPIQLGGTAPVVHILWRDVTAARAAAEEVRTSRERQQLALDASASGVWEWDVDEHRLSWDARAQSIFGLPFNPAPVSFEVLRTAVHPDDLLHVATALKRAFADGSPVDLEHRIRWPDGQVRYVAATGRIGGGVDGQPLRLTGIMRDVTARRAAADALRREKEFTESLLNNTVDAIVALDPEQRITAWNAEAARCFAREAAAALGQPLFELLPQLDAVARAAVAQVLAGAPQTLLGRPLPEGRGTCDVHGVPLRHPDQPAPYGALFIVRDVTERNRLAEDATQLRLHRQQEVLAAILTTQESERKRIAEALHNGLGQLLYATKLGLERGGTPAAAPREVLKLLDEAIRTTRTISFELTPGILEDFGLRTALEELVKRLAGARLTVHLHVAGLNQRLPPQVEIAVYRTVQELLNNVMKHAEATEAVVHVALEDGRLDVSVEDNGLGFEPNALATQPLGGIGLSGVRNRVALLGGEVQINSRLGQGTIVSFELAV